MIFTGDSFLIGVWIGVAILAVSFRIRARKRIALSLDFFKKSWLAPRVKAETEIILVSSVLNIYSVHKIELAPCLVQNADCRIRSGKISALIIRSKSNLV